MLGPLHTKGQGLGIGSWGQEQPGEKSEGGKYGKQQSSSEATHRSIVAMSGGIGTLNDAVTSLSVDASKKAETSRFALATRGRADHSEAGDIMRYLIIGGVAGGASTAARLRRLDEAADIVLFERGEHVSYANCGLPYYAGGAITDREKLFLMNAAKFKATLNVEVKVRHEVLSIHGEAKTVRVRDLETGIEVDEAYDALLYSPGAEPLRPDIPGIDDARVFTLRSVPDIDRIKAHVDEKKPASALVIGGGFIGLEMAENLHHRGMKVAIVEAMDQVMAPIDPEMAALVHGHIRDKGVELVLADGIVAFHAGPDALEVELKSGRRIATELVILSIGVRPDTRLARESGMAVDERGYVVVDDRLRTSIADVWAVGDAIVFPSPLTGKPQPVPLAGPANKQARIAAENIVFGDAARRWKGALGTAVAKVFDLTVASTGLAEKFCVREGMRAASVVVHPSSHASYYPGAKPLSLKVVYDPESGALLGAQAIGQAGADKRIDAFAAFLAMGATVRDLAEFEHAYAPPYAGAKDALNYAGFIAMNAMQGLTHPVSWKEAEAMAAEGAFLLDARTPGEFAAGHVEGAVLIPNTELRERLSEVPKDRKVVIYCGVGIRGYLSERVLRQHGYDDVCNVSGGFKTWDAVRQGR